MRGGSVTATSRMCGLSWEIVNLEWVTRIELALAAWDSDQYALLYSR